MQLRVRSLDGAEVLLAVPPLTVRVRVAEIKQRALAELLRLRVATSAEAASLVDETASDMETADRHGAHACVAFRGQLLADADDVNLFALTPSDFFVLIEEESDDAEDDEEDGGRGDQETKQSGKKPRASTSRRRKKPVTTSDMDHGLAEAVVMQLIEMGFPVDQAREATMLACGELPRAIALLTGEVDASTVLLNGGGSDSGPQTSRLREYVADLVRRYPELAAIESLLQNEQVHRLKRVALTSDFEALVLLKEAFPSHWLAQMNENPAATTLFLAIPDQFESAGSDLRQTTSALKKAKKTTDEVDLTSSFEVDKVTAGSSIAQEQGAIDRLTAMGFASDLVVAILESCGGNEELAANLLFETLQ